MQTSAILNSSAVKARASSVRAERRSAVQVVRCQQNASPIKELAKGTALVAATLGLVMGSGAPAYAGLGETLPNIGKSDKTEAVGSTPDALDSALRIKADKEAPREAPMLPTLAQPAGPFPNQGPAPSAPASAVPKPTQLTPDPRQVDRNLEDSQIGFPTK